MRFTVAGAGVNECPVSFITGPSLSLLDTYNRISAIHDMGGSVGTMDDWPAADVDAFIIFSNEEAKYKNARAEARAARDRCAQLGISHA